jgi:hypothetical protein
MSDVARIMGPLLLWLALFSGVYALHGLGCGLGWDGVPLAGHSLHRTALLAAWAASFALQAGLLILLVGPLRSAAPFARRISVALAVAGLVAVAWSLFPVAFATYCGP